MLGPNQHTFNLANQSYEERLSHSARIQKIQHDRQTKPNYDLQQLTKRYNMTFQMYAGSLQMAEKALNSAKSSAAKAVKKVKARIEGRS